MQVSRRAALAVAGALGLGTGAVVVDEDDDTDLSYGTVPYGEQGYGG